MTGASGQLLLRCRSGNQPELSPEEEAFFRLSWMETYKFDVYFCKTLGQQLFFFMLTCCFLCLLHVYVYIYMNSFIKATSNEFWVLWTGRGTSSASRQPEYLRRCHGGAEFVPCGKCHQSMGWSFFDRRSLNNLQCNHHHLGRTLAENCCRPCLNSGVNVEIEKNATVCQM